MLNRSYIGIDNTSNNEWVIVQRVEGKTRLSKQFRNTPAEIVTLVKFIRDRCSRPKICLKSTSHTAINLINYISGIPDVEVVIMSEAGLMAHQTWLPTVRSTPQVQRTGSQAELLARCAERII